MTAATAKANIPCRALVPAEDPAPPDIDRTHRPTAPYLTQLLTAKYGLPHASLRRRVDAHDATAIYESQSAVIAKLRHHLLSRML